MILGAAPFGIRVVDRDTGRGVPLITLRTVNQIELVTDNLGYAAFLEPGLMNRKTFFHVEGPGYEFPADGFGYRGLALQTEPGKIETIKVVRTQIAERVSRLTGQGLWRDSALLEIGPDSPLNASVTGQDTAQAIEYKGKLLWFWGDTDRADYPLGNFYTTGAVARSSGKPLETIDFDYFRDDKGFVRAMVPSTKPHPIWISGLAVVEDNLIGYYSEMESLGKILSHGLLKWNDDEERFDRWTTFDTARGWKFLEGHLTRHGDYLIGGNLPAVRVRNRLADVQRADAYEAFSCLAPDGTVNQKDGKAVYAWTKSVEPITSQKEFDLVKSGKLQASDAHFLPIDQNGKPAVIVSGSVAWNAHRKRWLGIFGRRDGEKSFLGEIVVSEADSPTGPFRKCVTVADHPNYTFYNPVHHPFLDDGRFVYFEGTYTAEFSGNAHKTPRYNYNQLLYRLDLDDPRIKALQ